MVFQSLARIDGRVGQIFTYQTEQCQLICEMAVRSAKLRFHAHETDIPMQTWRWPPRKSAVADFEKCSAQTFTFYIKVVIVH
jgi:hypothetical protein